MTSLNNISFCALGAFLGTVSINAVVILGTMHSSSVSHFTEVGWQVGGLERPINVASTVTGPRKSKASGSNWTTPVTDSG